MAASFVTGPALCPLLYRLTLSGTAGAHFGNIGKME